MTKRADGNYCNQRELIFCDERLDENDADLSDNDIQFKNYFINFQKKVTNSKHYKVQIRNCKTKHILQGAVLT